MLLFYVRTLQNLIYFQNVRLYPFDQPLSGKFAFRDGNEDEKRKLQKKFPAFQSTK